MSDATDVKQTYAARLLEARWNYALYSKQKKEQQLSLDYNVFIAQGDERSMVVWLGLGGYCIELKPITRGNYKHCLTVCSGISSQLRLVNYALTLMGNPVKEEFLRQWGEELVQAVQYLFARSYGRYDHVALLCSRKLIQHSLFPSENAYQQLKKVVSVKLSKQLKVYAEFLQVQYPAMFADICGPVVGHVMEKGREFKLSYKTGQWSRLSSERDRDSIKFIESCKLLSPELFNLTFSQISNNEMYFAANFRRAITLKHLKEIHEISEPPEFLKEDVKPATIVDEFTGAISILTKDGMFDSTKNILEATGIGPAEKMWKHYMDAVSRDEEPDAQK